MREFKITGLTFVCIALIGCVRGSDTGQAEPAIKLPQKRTHCATGLSTPTAALKECIHEMHAWREFVSLHKMNAYQEVVTLKLLSRFLAQAGVTLTGNETWITKNLHIEPISENQQLMRMLPLFYQRYDAKCLSDITLLVKDDLKSSAHKQTMLQQLTKAMSRLEGITAKEIKSIGSLFAKIRKSHPHVPIRFGSMLPFKSIKTSHISLLNSVSSYLLKRKQFNPASCRLWLIRFESCDIKVLTSLFTFLGGHVQGQQAIEKEAVAVMLGHPASEWVRTLEVLRGLRCVSDIIKADLLKIAGQTAGSDELVRAMCMVADMYLLLETRHAEQPVHEVPFTSLSKALEVFTASKAEQLLQAVSILQRTGAWESEERRLLAQSEVRKAFCDTGYQKDSWGWEFEDRLKFVLERCADHGWQARYDLSVRFAQAAGGSQRLPASVYNILKVLDDGKLTLLRQNPFLQEIACSTMAAAGGKGGRAEVMQLHELTYLLRIMNLFEDDGVLGAALAQAQAEGADLRMTAQVLSSCLAGDARNGSEIGDNIRDLVEGTMLMFHRDYIGSADGPDVAARLIVFNLDKIIAASPTQIKIPVMRHADLLMRDWRRLLSRFQTVDPLQEDYISSEEILCGSLPAGTTNSEKFDEITTEIIERLEEIFYNKPEKKYWHFRDAELGGFRKVLQFLADRLTLTSDMELLNRYICIFLGGMLKCPAGQKAAADILIEALTAQEAVTGLESQIRSLVTRAKIDGFRRTVFSGTDRQNVHTLSFYEVVFNKALGLGSHLDNYRDNLHKPEDDLFCGYLEHLLFEFWNDFNSESLTGYVFKYVQTAEDRGRIMGLCKAQEDLARLTAGRDMNPVLRVLRSRLDSLEAKIKDYAVNEGSDDKHEVLGDLQKQRMHLERQISQLQKTAAPITVSDHAQKVTQLRGRITQLKSEVAADARARPLMALDLYNYLKGYLPHDLVDMGFVYENDPSAGEGTCIISEVKANAVRLCLMCMEYLRLEPLPIEDKVFPRLRVYSKGIIREDTDEPRGLV